MSISCSKRMSSNLIYFIFFKVSKIYDIKQIDFLNTKYEIIYISYKPIDYLIFQIFDDISLENYFRYKLYIKNLLLYLITLFVYFDFIMRFCTFF